MKVKRGLKSRKKSKQSEEIESDVDEVSSSTESEGRDSPDYETAHEKRVRLTKKIIEKAREQVGTDDEGIQALSLKLREEALLLKGRLVTQLAADVSLASEKIVRMKGHKRATCCVCLSEDGFFAFSGGKDSSVIKWDMKDFKKMIVLRGGKRGSNYCYHTGPVLSIAICNDGKYLASSSMDETVIIWNPETLEVIMKLRRHRAAVTAVAFRRQSHMLFTADCTGRVCVWNMPLSEVLQDQGARTNIEVLGLCGLSAERCVSCSGFGGPGICVWKVAEEVCVQYTAKNPVETAIECVYAVNDEIFIGGSATNSLYIWHSSRGSPVFTVSHAHPEPKILNSEPGQMEFHRPVASWVTAVAGLSGTDLLATGASTGHVQLWRIIQAAQSTDAFSADRATQQQQRTQVKLERLRNVSIFLNGFVNALAFSPDRRFLLVALGQEHRLGKWEPRRPVDPALCLIPLKLPAKFLVTNR
ncbi:unnamed protein product [Calicophoron daubneyi]|uniref:U3 small nucleolar RNA-interacting protein 2 n=1 Tax=Calicophoron daubneyi TaxID=300641 RepID=A0AAV2T154_CALDB